MQANTERAGEVPPPEDPSTVPTPRQPLDDGLSDFPTAIIPVVPAEPDTEPDTPAETSSDINADSGPEPEAAAPDATEAQSSGEETEEAPADAPVDGAEPDTSEELDAGA